jgi:hypothetical protein
MDELHDVAAQSPTTGQTLVYNASTSLWEKNTVSLTAGVNGTLPVANGGTGITSLGTGVATFLGTPSSANLAAAVTDETGSGALVFANTPTLIAPALGTPTALVGTNITGTATNFTASNVTTNANLTGMVTSVGNATTVVTNANLTGAITSSGNATSLGSFTSANLAAALTDETGTGANVFATSPTLVTPALGTPSALVGTNITGTAANFNINGTVGATTPNTGNFTTLTENNIAVVTQSDIGSAPNEIPLNQYLGSLAYQNGDAYYNTGMTVGFRNRILNGNMMIDQRNAGASVTVDTFNIYSVDRFALETGGATGGGVYTAQRSSVAPNGFVNSLLCTVTTTDTSLASGDLSQMAQNIEGVNIADLGWGTTNASPVTLSFWVRSSVTGAYSVGFQNAGNNRSIVGVYTINAANTWEYKTITVSGDTTGTWNTSNGVGISLRFCFATGDARVTATPYTWVGANAIAISSTANPLMGTSGATFYITGVQLEKGNIATSFDVRPYGTELALCQRYFESNYPLGTAVGSAVATASLQTFGTAVYYAAGTLGFAGGFNFRVTKRATPTVTLYNKNGTSGQWFWGVLGASEGSTTTAIDAVNTSTFFLVATAPIASSTGAYGYYAATSEL